MNTIYTKSWKDWIHIRIIIIVGRTTSGFACCAGYIFKWADCSQPSMLSSYRYSTSELTAAKPSNWPCVENIGQVQIVEVVFLLVICRRTTRCVSRDDCREWYFRVFSSVSLTAFWNTWPWWVKFAPFAKIHESCYGIVQLLYLNL